MLREDYGHHQGPGIGGGTNRRRQGKEPTYVNVRQKLGTGSFTTIQKYLRDWRTADQTEPEVTPDDSPRGVHGSPEPLRRGGVESGQRMGQRRD